jgi:hypothetical protein
MRRRWPAPADAAPGKARFAPHGLDETPADKHRRERAIKVAHAINGAEAAAIRGSATAAYKRGSQVSLPEIPDNFSLTFFVNGRTTYASSLNEFADSCNFAILSDQDGHVYAAQPQQAPATP